MLTQPVGVGGGASRSKSVHEPLPPCAVTAAVGVAPEYKVGVPFAARGGEEEAMAKRALRAAAIAATSSCTLLTVDLCWHVAAAVLFDAAVDVGHITMRQRTSLPSRAGSRAIMRTRMAVGPARVAISSARAIT